MTSTRRTYEKGSVGPERLLLDFVKGRYCFENFMQSPLSMSKAGGTEGLVPTGTSLNEQIVNTGRHTFEYYFAGDVTDAFVPTLATEGGYNWLFTDVLDSGFELNFGGLLAGHPRNFQPLSSDGSVGEDWFARILLITDDASGAHIVFGFRKVASPAATMSEYSDVFGVRILGASGSTDAAFSVITSATDFTATSLTGVTGLEDATAIELEVRAVGGKGQLYINGAEVTGFTQKSFVAGHVFAPVLRGLQATDVWAQLKTLAYEAGPLACRQEGSLLSLAGATA
jgi:hypothetical protein